LVRLTFVTNSGAVHEVSADVGASAMQCAVSNSVPGIVAECGGACTCATCHVYVDPAWVAVVGPPEPMEADMLDFANDVRSNSRLSCQIKVKSTFDGLVLRIPETQG
jgi:2Fe-2S ferredoxin